MKKKNGLIYMMGKGGNSDKNKRNSNAIRHLNRGLLIILLGFKIVTSMMRGTCFICKNNYKNYWS
jgi:hypothetical protein